MLTLYQINDMHKRYTRLFSSITLLLLLWSSSALAAQAADEPDFAVDNGWYYTQTGSDTGRGYAITDNGGIAFWTGFQQFGGVPELGYPVSGRFILNGFVYQATQRTLLQWDSANSSVNIANTFDLLHDANYNGWLEAFRQIPQSFDWSSDDPINDWEGTIRSHLTRIFEAQPGDTPELVAARAALQERFLSNPNWLQLSGLPLAIQDFGPLIVMRAQRVALQYWKVKVPWANVGDVTVVLGGDIAKESGLIPAAATIPLDAAAASLDSAPPSATLPPAGQQTPPPPPPPPQPVTPPGLPIERILADSVADQLSIVGPPAVISSPHGNLRVYLRLRNDANLSVSSALDVLVIDAGGEVIGHASGDVVTLLPGSTRAVRLLSSDPFAEPAALELRFTGTLVGGGEYERTISFSTAQYALEGNLHVLRGTVTNNGNRPYSLFLGGEFLDAAGGVLGLATGQVSNLFPGETRAFLLTTAENVQGVVSYEVGVNVIVPK